MLTIAARTCAKDTILPLLPYDTHSAHTLLEGEMPLATGWSLYSPNDMGSPLFQIVGQVMLPLAQASQTYGAFPLLKAMRSVAAIHSMQFLAKKHGYSAAIITLSDKGSQGLRIDTAGPLCQKLLAEAIPLAYVTHFIIPDEPELLRALLSDLALIQKYDLVCTSGGTGLGPRDITPQVTARLLDLELPGFMQAMMAASLAKTARGAISRALAGVIANCMIINLPGSKKAVEENLLPLMDSLDHAMKKLKGDPSDCGS